MSASLACSVAWQASNTAGTANVAPPGLAMGIGLCTALTKDSNQFVIHVEQQGPQHLTSALTHSLVY